MQEDFLKQVKFKFVAMGTSAPDPIPQNEIWLDVGNRLDMGVLDHHAGDSDAPSSAHQVLSHIQDLIVPHFNPGSILSIVLHKDPDLDAICSAWLVKKHLLDSVDIQNKIPIEEIVQAVSENDQGLVRTSEPLNCWPIIMRTLISKAHERFSDDAVITEVFPLLERTFEILRNGGSLVNAAKRILTPELRILLSFEQRDYQLDFSRGFPFQIRLPLQSSYSSINKSATKMVTEERRVLVDALFLSNPTSALFKEIARGDLENSPLKQGFPFLVVAEDVRLQDGQLFQRFIISVDPLTGLHLKNLGELLEAREQAKENELKKPLLPGRERVKPGEGRFGGTILNPWYDGRGFHYTIVDSPSIQIDGGKYFSQLNKNEVLDTIWAYADPSLFVGVQSAEQISFCPGNTVFSGRDQESDFLRLEAIIAQTDHCCRWGTDMKLLSESFNGSAFSCASTGEFGKLFNDLFVKVNRVVLPEKGNESLGKIIQSFAIQQDVKPALPKSVGNSNKEVTTLNRFFIITIPDKMFSLDREFDTLLLPLYRLVQKKESRFSTAQELSGCARVKKIFSPDRRAAFLIFPKGAVLLKAADFQEAKTFTRSCELLLSLVMTVRTGLDKISNEILTHLHISNPGKLRKVLHQDRERLFWFQHSAMFTYACEDPFIQQVYEAIQAHWEIPKKFEQEAQRVNTLAQSFREASDALSAKLSFIATTAIAPLLLTLAFFSGTFMDTAFHSKYRTFFPSKFILWLAKILHISPGWAAFIAVFGAFAFLFASIWTTITRLGKGRKSK
ncbi:MAG: DHH family phosphoesterase [Thermodesulfovibrionales bacterium]|nr:DHH family phosphoesterase [Thermodesulfovibrionales bacterium]